jgi:DNA-binding HxlR family transcriptional regulator
MPRLKPNDSFCSVAKAIDLLGDRWMLLLIREVVFGTRRFDDFAQHLGIARNVLADRLARLVAAGVLVQQPLQSDGRRLGYRFSPMGEDLLPVLIGFMQWGDRWLQTPDTIPVVVVERATGKPVPRIRVRNDAGQALGLRELDWTPGPGAGHPRVAKLVAAYEAQRATAPRPVPAPPAASDRARKPAASRRKTLEPTP